MKPKITIANALSKSEDGYHEGFIASAEFTTAIKREKHGREFEEIEYPCFELKVNFDGTADPITVKIQTGVSLSVEPIEIRNAGRGKKNEVPLYNRFTTLLLNLGVLNEETLKTVDATNLDKIMKNAEGLSGRYVRCKVGKNEKGYLAVDISTLVLLEKKQSDIKTS